MKPIEDLKAEHEGILLMLNVLEKMCERIKSGDKVPTEHLKQVLEFLQVFADKCHHGKEEGILFPAMQTAGVPKEGGPLGVMLSEHGSGRNFIGEMKSLLQSHEKGDAGSLTAFTNPALQYINLLRNHIWKENNVLFPMAEKAVSQDKLESIGQEFDKFEDEVIGQGTHEAFHKMMDKLSKDYL